MIYTVEFIKKLCNNNFDLTPDEITFLTRLKAYFPREIKTTGWRKPQETIVKDNEDARTLNSHLNKLSHKNYNKILELLLACLDKSPVLLNNFIDNIFEKAVLQGGYCGIYAQLCSHVDDKHPLRELLLNKCKILYNSATSIVQPNIDTEYDAYCKYVAEKTKYIGNFQLIGELYKYDLITNDILKSYMDLLLIQIDSGATSGEGLALTERYCESYCKLITTIMKKIKNDTSKTDIIDSYTATCKRMSKSKTIGNRIRFMFQDVIDLQCKNP